MATSMSILARKPLPLSRPHLVGKEKAYVEEAIASGRLSGDGPFTKKVSALLEHDLPSKHIFLTTSCTSALELAAMLLLPDIRDNERNEVIVPSFTFVSTVNAFLIHGFSPVFCDVDVETGNVSVDTIAPHITKRTRVIAPVHYAGAPCDMAPIVELAAERGASVVEDAAQALYARRDGKHAGTFGDFGAYSFHDTKNFVCGEGGALSVNNEQYLDRAAIIREKGTNRAQFLLGQVDKYTWVDVGSSFLPSDILAAFLLAQLEGRDEILARRSVLFRRYHDGLAPLVAQGLLRVPVLPSVVESNYHLFFIVVSSLDVRGRLMKHLNEQGIGAAFHYPALHRTPMGVKLGAGDVHLPGAEALSDRLLRLPFFCDMADDDVDRVVDSIAAFYR